MKQHLQHGNSVMAKLKDNMLQGTLQAVGEGRERVEGEKRARGAGELVQGIHVATC